MEVQTKDELLEQISLAVEQIQKQFVQGGNVIKDCQETFFLCQCVDNILHHGLKEGLISWAMESTVWPLLEKITCSKDIEEIKMLRLKTTRDKCHAWIKMAVNENLLGSYIAAINQDHSLLIHHYYEYAFLRDPVMTDTVKSILNYGIANFDFEISISHSQPSSKFDARSKQDQPCDYDAVEQTAPKENGLEPSNIETEIAATPDTLSKRRRKKKVKTVVIEDQDDGDDFEETKEKVEVEEENLEESKVDGRKDKITFKNGGNDMQFSTETSSTTTDQSDNSKTSDVRTNRIACSVNGHVIDAACDSVIRDADDGLQDSTSERTDFVSAQVDQYLTFKSRENRDDGRRKNKELDTLGRQIERASPIQEFNTNDFLLDETEPQNTLNDNKEVLEGASNNTYCSKEPKNATKGDSGANLQKSENLSESLEIEAELTVAKKKITNISSISENEHSGSPSGSSINNKDGERLSEALTKTEHSSNSQRFKSQESIGSTKEENVSNDEFSEVLSRSYSYDYRVRRIENVDFVSSSYGSSSALSDLTDDDRDLNFIPGIHRMSSKSFTSSFEKKSAADSSVSFDENGFPLFESSHYTDSLTSQHSSTDDNSRSFSDLSNEWDLFEDLLNVEEEHFSKPDNFAGLTTTEELEIAIEHYKKLIKTRRNKSQQRDDLVKKLVKLRLRLQQENEGPPEENPQCRKILSHQFSKKEGKKEGTKYFCDQCGKNIWTIWQALYTCNDCGYYSHRKCLEHIQRPCPKRNLSTVSYIMEICPDTGLDAQQYRCAECRKEIAFSKKLVAEGRICDYTGQYFCDNCHWNDQVTIPARVLRNWDFSQRKVCRKTKQLLELMKARPILNIQEINPMLYRYVEELREVGKLREDILIMKKYFLTCREALESKLLIQLQKRQHFVDSAHTYSFQDLLDLNNDVLLPEVSKVHSLFLAHIKADCELCRARGFICEMCQDSSDIIFAFDPHAVKCTNCSAVFHKVCFKPDDCPKCQRRKKVAEEQE